ncbi:hypothetical protein TSAR_003988 [Trichomalopsis sarcophagae]|uniref:Uncharacterized protein n=1 Tax=Trichomalopsis sarcophagae TaxID=543379 RepID=A0A232F3Y1_9HYME|nr:hypothetical protein TSAR_003988 [Trichomalopsis sarcophagae]
MSGSDSDSDSNEIKNGPFRCTCKCGVANCLDVSYTDCDDTESEESFSDDSLSQTSTDNKKTIFISIFNHKTQRNKNLISDTVEIKNYREQYQKLPLKNVNNIKKIWADVKVDMPLLGQIPLKCIDDELTEVKKGKYSHKKKLKKPTHLMQNKLSADSPANNSQQSVVADKSHKIGQPVVKQVHEKLPQAQINKKNTKDTKIKKANESILKGATKNTTSNENKNPKNEPKVSNKSTQSVKPHIIKDNLKFNTGKTVNSNSNALTSIQPIIETNSTNNISNTSNKKSNNQNNSAKVDTIKTPVKAIVENKIKKNEENKKKTIADSCLSKKESKEDMKIAKINLSTQSYTKSISKVKSENSNSDISNMKSSAEDKTVKVDNFVKSEAKMNTENRIEKTNLVELNAKSNTENKIVKDESINSNVESDVESQTLNNNLNKKLKLEVIEFRIPNSNKIIPSSNRNENENSANDKNLQSNKKLSKKQKKKMRQKEKNLEANVKDISTSNTRDLSISSSKSFDDKKSKNNSNKNVKEEATKPKKKEVNNTDKDKTKNKKLIEPEHSEQDTEEFEIEEMNSISNDNLDLLTDTKHMPTFIADIIKRKKKKTSQNKASNRNTNKKYQ